jgi:hypothetical protein
MKKPRFVIKTVDEDCTVLLFDENNILLHKEEMEGEDPYLWIGRFRDSVQAAEVVEFPRMKLTHELNREISGILYAAELVKQVKMLEASIAGLRKTLSEYENKEVSFTDNLS